MYIAVRIDTDDGAKLQPMQILSLSKPFTNDTFLTQTEYLSRKVTVQPLERWSVLGASGTGKGPYRIEAFAMEEPIMVEITTLVKYEDRDDF